MTNNATLEDLKSLIPQRAQNQKTTGHTQVRKTRDSSETPFYRPLNFRNVGVVGSNPIISTTKIVRAGKFPGPYCITAQIADDGVRTDEVDFRKANVPVARS